MANYPKKQLTSPQTDAFTPLCTFLARDPMKSGASTNSQESLHFLPGWQLILLGGNACERSFAEGMT